MKPLSPQARRLFDLSRDEPEPDVLTRGRIACALEARIAFDAGAATAGGSGAVGSGVAPVAGKAVLLTTLTRSVLVASAGVVATVGWLTLHPSPQHANPESVRSEAHVVARSPLVENTSPGQPSAAPPVKVPGTLSPRRPVAGSSSHLARDDVREGAPQSPNALHAEAATAESTRRPSLEPRPAPRAGDQERLPALAPPAESSVKSSPSTNARPGASQPDDPLRAETDALRMAQQALRDGQPRLTLALLDAQDLHFSEGALKQERLAARVLALCRSGLVAEARAQAVRFEQLWPRSPLKSRVRSACWGR